MKTVIEIAESLRNENEKCYKECEGCCCDVENDICACKDAIILSALERLIPKKPIRVSVGHNGSSTDGCQICKREFYEKFTFCPDCGTAIDWS